VKLKSSVAWLEDAIITISGPALAISGIIAGVDLVTGGNILKSMPFFTMTWAITLLLTLDFQVLALGVRAHRVYLSSKGGWHKAGEIVLAVVIAAAISFVSIQMQSIIARVNAEHITIDVAAAQLGISTLALIWERSTLVLVLIFMSGWLREHENLVVETPVQSPLDLDTLFTKLEERLDRRIEGVYQRIDFKIEQVTNPNMPALPARAETRTANDQPIYAPQFESKEGVIADILLKKPDASLEEVAQEAGCSERTAEKWLLRLRGVNENHRVSFQGTPARSPGEE
jgi:hypothetical protein